MSDLKFHPDIQLLDHEVVARYIEPAVAAAGKAMERQLLGAESDLALIRAIELVECLTAVADAAWEQKDLTAARHAYSLVLDQDPANAHAMNRLGRIALAERKPEQAIDHFSAAFLIAPEPIVCVNLAVAYGRAGDFTQALLYCAEAITLDPRCKLAYVQQSAIYDEMCQPQDAEAILNRALELFPGDDNLLFARGVHQLARGDYENGWRNYEHRIARLELAAKLDEYAEWQGEPFHQGHVWKNGSTYCAKCGGLGTVPRCGKNGGVLLVCGEQGMGDQIMWARYIPLLRELGAEVVFFTTAELARLMALSFPDVLIVTSDRELAAVDPDYWIAIGSLPSRCVAGGDYHFPDGEAHTETYLAPNAADVGRLATQIADTGNLRVGLCWRGNPQHMWDRYRSLSWEQMKPLADVPGVDFYSLQVGGVDESGLPSLTAYCHDFADTAAAISHLDVVITVDTAVAHLAGAMGKQVWLLLGTPNDWRWGNGLAAYTPWYPSMRIFRAGGIERAVAVLSNPDNDLRATTSIFAPTIEGAKREVTTKYGHVSWPTNDHYIGRALSLYGQYSESEAELLRRVLKPGDAVVEAGANIGSLTLPMSDAVGARGIVYACEPQMAYFAHLQRNCAGRPGWTVPMRVALGAVCENPVTMCSVEEQKVHAPGWPSRGPVFQVQQITIDYLELSRCALIKVDVDGQEHDILRGAAATIDRCRPLVYVEYDKPEEYPDMLPWLAARGYRLYRHLAPLYDPQNLRQNRLNVFGSMVSLMVLAIPNERKDLHPGEWGLERIRLEKSS